MINSLIYLEQHVINVVSAAVAAAHAAQEPSAYTGVTAQASHFLSRPPSAAAVLHLLAGSQLKLEHQSHLNQEK